MAIFCLFFFLSAIVVQCGYAFYFFYRICVLPGTTVAVGQKLPVSIIICAKNEAENLKKYLPSILSQRYTNDAGKSLFEVVVVNDASTDETNIVLHTFEKQYDNLKVITITAGEERTFKGKKFALSRGTAQASHDYLLLTDADCQPASNLWLQQMTAPLFNSKEIVAGYGGFYRDKGLLNAFIRWETLHTFLQYSTYALAGMPYMAVGRNLACRKQTFIQAQQAQVWNKLPSGDDDLLVNIMANNTNMTIESHATAFTYSAAKTNWRQYIAQKQRHLSTGKFYNKRIKTVLGIYAICHAILWLYFFLCLIFISWKLVTAIMLFRCLIYWVVWYITAKKINEKNLTPWFPLFDIGWLIYNFVFSPYIFWKTRKQWK